MVVSVQLRAENVTIYRTTLLESGGFVKNNGINKEVWISTYFDQLQTIIAAKCAYVSSYLDAFDKEFPCRFVWMDGWMDRVYANEDKPDSNNNRSYPISCFRRRNSQLDKAQAKSRNTNETRR